MSFSTKKINKVFVGIGVASLLVSGALFAATKLYVPKSIVTGSTILSGRKFNTSQIPENTLAGIRLGRKAKEILMKWGNPTRITVGGISGAAGGGAAGMMGGGLGMGMGGGKFGGAGMGGPGMGMGGGKFGGAGMGGGLGMGMGGPGMGMGGGKFGGAGMMGGGLGMGMGDPGMGMGAMQGENIGMGGAGMGGPGMGMGGGKFGGAGMGAAGMGMGIGMGGGKFGGAGMGGTGMGMGTGQAQQVSNVRPDVTWTYDLLNGITLEFVLTEGIITQITVGGVGPWSGSKLISGLQLGDTYKLALWVSGYPETQSYNGRFLRVSYVTKNRSMLTFLNKKLVGVTIAMIPEDLRP